MGQTIESGSSYARLNESAPTERGFSEDVLRKRTESAQSVAVPQQEILEKLTRLSHEMTALLEQYTQLLGTDVRQAQRIREAIDKNYKEQQELLQSLGK